MATPNVDFALSSLKARGATLGTFAVYLVFASIYFPNTLLVRPHPAFWRVVLALMLALGMFETYILLLPRDEARQAITYFDKDLGQQPLEITYADDCRLYTPDNPEGQFANIYFAVFDVHFFAHFLGWFAKMIIMRDWYVVWACSLVFELLELTFLYWLPNFAECWWDSLLLDVFGCNLLGSLIGYWFLKFFGVTEFHWVRGEQRQDLALH